jgi:5-methylcytosine-specific restriction endonuclease McrA
MIETRYNRAYHAKRWKKLRSAVLKRDGYACLQCGRKGERTTANTVHHIIPGPEGFYDMNNCVSLCRQCHEAMHDKMSNKLTELGESWKQRKLNGKLNRTPLPF